MHEAGLAAAIAGALRREPADGSRVRLLVSGGHGDPVDFDESLRFHLAVGAPELDLRDMEIVHLAVDRLCAWCGRTFSASEPDAVCSCGGSSLPIPTPERVEIEMVRPDATSP